MKRLLKIVLSMALLAVMLALPVTGQAQTVSGAGVGLMLQKGESSQFCYAIGLQVPVLSRDSSGAWVLIDPDIVYADRSVTFDDQSSIKEFTGARGFVSGVKTIGFWDLRTVTGIGAYHFTNSEGGDKTQAAFRLAISGKPIGTFVYAGVDIVKFAGPDLYNINVAVRFLKI